MTLRKFSVFFLAIVMLLTLAVPAYAAEGDAAGERFNIVIVTDNSGSLVHGNESDPEGYRYDAINMFLDLLTDSGNNVAAVVFQGNINENDTSEKAMLSGLKLNTDLLPLNGKKAKDDLVKKIKAHQPKNGYTDIGTALLAAAQKLDGMTEQNGLRSIIVLFSDGMTQMPGGKDSPAYKQSIANQEQAKEIILENGITLCGVYLRGKKGDAENSEVLNLVREANNCDEDIALDKLEDLYIPVDDARSLSDAYKGFFTLITGTSATEFQKELEFEVPGMGIADINISLLAQGNSMAESREIMSKTNLTIIRPDQTKVSSSELGKMMSGGDSYAVYKLQGLEPGIWKVFVETPNPANLNSSLLLSTNVSAQMSLAMEGEEFVINRPISVSAQLLHNGVALPDQAAYQQYDCFLEVLNTDDPQAQWKSIPMEYQSGSNSYACRVSTDTYGKFHARVVFRCGSAIRIESGSETWSVRNQNPQAEERLPISIQMSLQTSGAFQINMRDLVTDREDAKEAITITVNGANYPPNGYTVEGDLLNIDGAIGGSGSIFITFEDTDGGITTTELQIQFDDITPRQTLKIVLWTSILLAALIIALVMKRFRDNSVGLKGIMKISIVIGNSVVAIKPMAADCQHKTLKQILEDQRIPLVTEAKWKHVSEDAVNQFLSRNEANLSTVFIEAKKTKGCKERLCFLFDTRENKSGKLMEDESKCTIALGGNGECVTLEYYKYR